MNRSKWGRGDGSRIVANLARQAQDGNESVECEMRVLITSLNTYTGPYNDGPLEHLGPQLDALTAVAADVPTLWGREHRGRAGAGYRVIVLRSRLARSVATTRLVGLDSLGKEFRPTLVHVGCEPWQGVAVQSLKLARRLRVPVGIHFAETGPLLNGIGGALRRARGSWVLKRCDYAVGWSTASARVAEQLAPGIPTETFPATGVAVDAEVCVSPDDWFGPDSAALPKLAFVGRFAEEKGIRDFLGVCDELARRLPLRAALAGGQGLHEMVRRWADDRPWAFLHDVLPRTGVRSLLAAADALVCPSRTTSFWEEQFGKSAVESMAVGTPVFAYSCCSLPEVIGAGGVVVGEGEQRKLADELQHFFALAATDRVALAENALSQAARFSDAAIADRLIGLWSRYSSS